MQKKNSPENTDAFPKQTEWSVLKQTAHDHKTQMHRQFYMRRALQSFVQFAFRLVSIHTFRKSAPKELDWTLAHRVLQPLARNAKHRFRQRSRKKRVLPLTWRRCCCAFFAARQFAARIYVMWVLLNYYSRSCSTFAEFQCFKTSNHYCPQCNALLGSYRES